MSEGTFASWINEVRLRLTSPSPRRLPPGDGRPAAVLVPLYVDHGELWTLLTKRTDDLPSHKGQIAFPGGGLETGEDPWSGALRESREELGLDPKRVVRLGQLDEVTASSGYHVVPCVGAVPYPLETEINRDEIDEVIPVPITAFLNPTLIEDRTVTFDGTARDLRIYHIGGRQIWGLTAGMVQNLLFRLGLELMPEV